MAYKQSKAHKLTTGRKRVNVFVAASSSVTTIMIGVAIGCSVLTGKRETEFSQYLSFDKIEFCLES